MDQDLKQSVALIYGEFAFTQNRLGLKITQNPEIFALVFGFEYAIDILLFRERTITLDKEVAFSKLLQKYETSNLPLNSIDDFAGDLGTIGISKKQALILLKYHKRANQFVNVVRKLELGGLDLP